MRVLLIPLAIVALFVSFQNCSRAEFSNAGGSESFVVVDANGQPGLEPGEECNCPPAPTPIQSPSPTPTDEPESSPTPAPTPKNPPKGPNDHPPGNPPKGEDGDHYYVCVVEGPGKSMKVALQNSLLGQKVGTPQDVCMSENACDNIISKAFNVKGPEFRGFCPNKNPHVVEMSDAEISALIDAMKP